FEIKVKTGSIQFQNSNYYVNSALSVAHSNPTLVLNEWVKVEATFFYAVENTSITHIYISGITANNQYEIRNCKIEKGSTATDWTPAIEDQVSDWSETDISKLSYIKNKPTLVNNYVDVIQTTNGTTAGTVYTFKRVGLSDLSLTLTAASASFSGVVTTGAQTFAGNKTVTGLWTYSGTNATPITIERTNTTNTNIRYINQGSSIYAGATNGFGGGVSN